MDSMAKPFKQLREKMSSEAQLRASEKALRMLDAMPLKELRQALKLSQEQLAESLETKQSSISKLENRTDIFISTLRRYIQAMGGDLEIVAHFPDGDVRINQFEEFSDVNSKNDNKNVA